MKKRNQILNILLPTIIGLELIILVLGNNSPQQIIHLLSDVLQNPLSWIYISLSMIIGYIGEALRGIRWKLLIEPLGYKVDTMDLINSCATGYMFNAGIPRSGEIARCTLLNKVSKTPISYLFGHVLVERAIDVVILFFCICLSIIYKGKSLYNIMNTNEYLSWVFTKNTLVVFIISLLIVALSYNIRHKIKSNKITILIKNYFTQIKTGIYSIFLVKEKKLFMFYTLLIWACYLLMTYVCFFCFSSMNNFTLMDGLFIMTIGGIGMVMPTPSGMGSYHFAVYIGLLILGQEADIGTAFGFLVHSAQTVMIITMGFIGLLLLNLKKPYNAKLAFEKPRR